MNKISKFAKLSKNIKIGENNIIHANVKIYDNVIIGNNNHFKNGTIIYPNCNIGNNNVFFNDNIIGEHPINSNDMTFKKKFNGVKIGNNNFFHVRNIIFGGNIDKTIILDNNKLLAESHIGHDVLITSNVILYPRCIIGGHSILCPYSTMGMYSSIQQRKVLGSYSMIGMSNLAAHDVFPFFIYVNRKYLKLNKYQIEKNINIDTNIEKYRDDLFDISNFIKNEKHINIEDIKKRIDKFPREIMDEIILFCTCIEKMKV